MLATENPKDAINSFILQNIKIKENNLCSTEFNNKEKTDFFLITQKDELF